MTLEDLFKLLSYGELTNLADSVEGTGTIKKEHRNRIITFANEALKRLHARFRLQEQTEELSLTTSAQDHTIPVDALQVYSIYTSYGESLVFSKTRVDDTIYVQGRNLHLPALAPNSAAIVIQVTYQNRHPELTPIINAEDLTQEIDLIPELQEALTAYIAQKVFGGMISAEAQGAAQGFRARYEQVCNEAAAQGLVPGEIEAVQKLEARGFV